MTLLVTEVHPFSLPNEPPFIVFAADRRISRQEANCDTREKIFKIPVLRAGIGYFGVAEVPAANRRVPMSEWLVKYFETIQLESSLAEGQAPETQLTSRHAIFYDEEKPFAIHESGKALRVLKGTKMYLRLIPTRPVSKLDLPDAYELAKSSVLEPMRDDRHTGITWVRNQYGAVAVGMNWETGEVFMLTQILRHAREIWGVDALTMNEEHCKGHGLSVMTNASKRKSIPAISDSGEDLQAWQNRELLLSSPIACATASKDTTRAG